MKRLKLSSIDISMTDITHLSVTIKKRQGTRGMRLRVRDDGSVTLTVPRFLSLKAAHQFLATKEDWIVAAQKRMAAMSPRLLNQGGSDEYRHHKEEVRRRVTERVAFFQKKYSVTASGISIRNQRSRFGSCSSRGHLSFNYRLLFLPPALLEYVIVHEVCHLREMNHSPRFWALVAWQIPDYQARKRELQVFSRIQD